ncbi:MAG: hypothetical protein COX07_06525 [Bacteroidetes bacterium CG23_combo_of_CG06-09_8_20_14_all_32_9]|nr:MAG: hypothetical protein COX07_06525 [Bacteroidetes bacterium CG23_combo_of_CG06-09_8_20_14_all_32_9]
MKNIIVFVFFCTFSLGICAKELSGISAQQIISGASFIRTNENTGFPDYILFQEENQIPVSKFHVWLNSFLKNPDKVTFKLLNKNSDQIGFTHYKYQQLLNGKPIDKAVFVIHTKYEKICSISGNIYVKAGTDSKVLISPDIAINIAKNKMNAVSYKWEIPSEEKQIKFETNNPKATYYPSPGLIIFCTSNGLFKNAYKLTLYSHSPVDKKEYFIDASTGEILDIRQKLYSADVIGTAVTRYSGSQTITTDSYSGSYRLREIGRGNGIETYNLNTGTDYGSATDFTDTDNYWNNVNAQQDEVATDAHWGAEKTYDYYYLIHGRNSIDGSGFKLMSYIHYDVSYSNAFWDGTRMTYGDDNGSPFTTLDICGHEITHGLTEFTAGLIYQDESGALNEGFSDIFGTSIEFYAKPSTANWTIGEDIGYAFRSLEDPNLYGDPDTYHGTNWSAVGEVHQNSTVLSHWFYLVSQGGSGTNDIGNSYNVTGIGIDSAQYVAFRMLTVYLPPNSTYDDARFFSIVSAIDLYGPCTSQVETVTNAMYAVGLGTFYIPSVVADFDSPLHTACSAPLTVNFQNISNNSSSFFWDFGDGATSTLVSPSHTYNNMGTYNVTLIADGGTCGIDTNIQNSFVSIDAANPCIVVIPLDGTGATQTSCSGKLFDGGGPTGNYADNSNAIITIAPTGATNVTLNFISFDVEPGDAGYCNYDYLEIFDGPNTSSASLGQFCNLTGSPGTISSSGGAITLLLHSDQGLNLSGFEIDWTCSLANTPPVANFSNTPVSTCTGEVSFSDQSTNGPTSWLWDFGDGNTSTAQNPTYTYINNGIYNITLIVQNAYGSDTLINYSLVTVNRPLTPIVTGDTVCENYPALLIANGNGIINWFALPSGGTILYTGTNFTTPVLNLTTTYYAENYISQPSQYVGPINNTSGGGYNTAQSWLIFDCFSPVNLVSVSVNAQTAGNRLIELKNSAGTILQSVTVTIPAGVSRITLNFNISAGTDLQLVGPANSELYRLNTGVSFPYVLNGLISIKNSNAGTGYYYYFYDWEVKEPDCISPRVPVVAVVENCQNISDNFNTQFQIFPNPVNDVLFINNIKQSEIKNIYLTDMTGRKIKLKYVCYNVNNFEVETNFLSQGIYMLTIETNIGNCYQKIVKE